MLFSYATRVYASIAINRHNTVVDCLNALRTSMQTELMRLRCRWEDKEFEQYETIESLPPELFAKVRESTLGGKLINFRRENIAPKIRASASTYVKRTLAPEVKQNVRGRMRYALANALPTLQHEQITSALNCILKGARHVRQDKDNPDTHLAFSPDNVGARDYKRRRSLTIGKFLRRKCAGFCKRFEITDAHIDMITKSYTASGIPEIESCQIVSGGDAHAVYADRDKGIRSCMSGTPTKASYSEAYFCKNPSNVFLVIRRDITDQLQLRARLFKNDDMTYYLDRVYTHDECNITTEAIRIWLKKSHGFELSNDYDFTLRHDDGDYMPYCDKADRFDRLSSCKVRFHANGEFSAESTNGEDNSSKIGKYNCCACSCHVDEDEVYTTDYGDSYCSDCYSEQFTYDEHSQCDISSDDARHDVYYAYISRNWNSTTGQYDKTSFTRQLTTHLDNCVELNNGEFWIKDDEAIVEIDYVWYRKTDCVKTWFRDEYILKDDAILLTHGEYAGQYAHTNDTITLDDITCLDGEVENVVDDYGNEITIFSTRLAFHSYDSNLNLLPIQVY